MSKKMWHPMEHAPKDGTRVLVLRGGEQYVASFMGHPWFIWGVSTIGADGQWGAFADIGPRKLFDQVIDAGPTHWMPLPDPPSVPREAPDA